MTKEKKETDDITIDCFLYGNLGCIVWLACQFNPGYHYIVEHFASICDKKVEHSLVNFQIPELFVDLLWELFFYNVITLKMISFLEKVYVLQKCENWGATRLKV